MDARARILVVEDHKETRETWAAVLEREDYRVNVAATAEAAIAAIDRCSYHVALVDLMLAGPDDRSNRDGVTVLQHLRELGEGTQALVLSAQKDDITLVRDLLEAYDDLKYVAKWEVEDKGNSFLLQRVRSALSACDLGAPVAWEELTPILAWGLPESLFVSECLQALDFKGGFENLSRSLLAASRQLVPLLIEVGASRAIARDRAPEVFSGRYWSKGQGSAIELLIFGRNASEELLEREWRLSAAKPLDSRRKGGLSIVVLERPDLARAQFHSAPAPS